MHVTGALSAAEIGVAETRPCLNVAIEPFASRLACKRHPSQDGNRSDFLLRKEKPSYNERWRIVPCPQLRQTPRTRAGKTVIRIASLFYERLQHFPQTEFGALVKENNAERCANSLAAGRNCFRCCSVNSPTPILCARFGTVWTVVWASWFISAPVVLGSVLHRP